MATRPTQTDIEQARNIPDGHDLLEMIVNECPQLADWIVANGCGEYVKED